MHTFLLARRPSPAFPRITISSKRKTTSSLIENKEKATANNQRRSASPLLIRESGAQSSSRIASPLASTNNSPTSLQSHSPQLGATSPMAKSFPAVLGSEESNHETSVIDITDTEAPRTSETEIETSRPDSTKSIKNSIKSCPCGKSSGGKSWLLKCIGCGQAWHNLCSNLKGQIPKSIIDNLDNWLCPWCFVCPYKPPKGHKSVKQSTTLTTAVISDSIVTKIEEAMKSCISNQNDELIKSIPNSLSTLQNEVKSFKDEAKSHNLVQSLDHAIDRPIESIMDGVTTIPTPEQPYSAYKPEFVSEQYALELKTFLDQEMFTSEGNREVVSYGEKYKYMGSKCHSTKSVPEILQPLISKISENIGYKLNQILVNKYSGPDALLPKHSDNEYDINPDSEIFTVSIGDTATVKFTSKYSTEF